VIELAEEIHGLAGQTQAHLVEKRKRDARVLNIYEGTNEIQRFFILKDLAGTTAAKSQERSRGSSSHEELELESMRLGVQQRVQAAVKVFGPELWGNPNLQANCFLLSEAAAWLKAADSVLARWAWLERIASDQESGTGGQQSSLPIDSWPQ